MVKITFFYDYICPFSYIGSNRIQKLATDYGIDVDWKGYEIHPSYPPDGVRRKNTPRTLRSAASLKAIMEEEDTKFKLPGFVTNSKYALMAGEYCKTQGKFIEFHNSCYEEYFMNRQNIGNREVILKIAGGIGIEIPQMKEQLATDKFNEILDEYRKEAELIDVLGVPTVIVNDFRVHGVQSIDLYRSLLKKFSN